MRRLLALALLPWALLGTRVSAAPKTATTLTLTVQRIITAGEAARLDGRLVDSMGGGVPNAGIDVVAHPTVDNGTSMSSTLQSDDEGRFHLIPKPTVSTVYWASFAGDKTYAASSTKAGQAVRVAVTERVQQNGRHFAFVGTTSPPKPGRTVALYERTHAGGTRYLGATDQIDELGRYAVHAHFASGCRIRVFVHLGDTSGNLAGNGPVETLNYCSIP